MSQHGQVGVIAGKTCTNHGIMTGIEVSLVGHDVIVETPKKREKTPHGHKESLERTAVVTATHTDVSLIGDNAVMVVGAHVKAKKDISMDAPLLLLGSQAQTTRNQTDTGLYETQQHQKSVFMTGNDFKPHAKEKFHIKGIDVICDGKIQLKSDGILKEETVSDKEHRVQTTKEDDGWFGSYKETSISSKSTPQRSTFTAKGGVEIEGRKNLTISAPKITTTQKGIKFTSQGKIKTGYTESSYHSSQQTSDCDFFFQSKSNKGHDHTTVLLPHMSAPEGVTFSSPQGVEVTVKAHTHAVPFAKWGQKQGGWGQKTGLNHALNVLENTPETAWIKSLRNNPAVNWKLVSEVHKEWNETTQGLAPGAGALISLAVVIATQGMGAQYIAPLLKGWTFGVETLGIIADAGFTTLVSQATTSLIGNKFDLGKTFQQLTSKENLLALGISMGTAGLTFGLCDKLGVSLNGMGFFDRLQRSAVQTGSSTVLRILTDNLDVGEALQQGAVNIVANSIGGWAANKIGQLYNPMPVLQDGVLVAPAPSINWIEHKILHGLSGGLLGAASNLKDPWKGAWGGSFGAIMGEILMEEMASSLQGLQVKAIRGSLTQDDLLDYKAQLEKASDRARLSTGFASFMLGQDVNASVLTATNAIENNFNATALSHLAQTLSQQDFTDMALKEWESEYGVLSLKAREKFRYKFARLQNILIMMDFSREALNPGQRLFEETASLPYEEFRTLSFSGMDPKKLSTPKGWRDAERITQNHYAFYQAKQVDLAFAPLFGLIAGGSGVARVLTKPQTLVLEGLQVANKNIARGPLALKAPKMADHHIFPQQFRRFFEQRGINIDKFTVSVGEVTHLKGLHGKGNGGLPGKWNQRWLSFIEDNPNASAREVYQFGGKLMDEYKLSALKVHDYKEGLK